MLATSAVGLAVYKFLKRTFVRERPFIRHAGISLAGAPLDRYSFPSGHTLHAVAFTWQAMRGISRALRWCSFPWRWPSPPRAWCSACTIRRTCWSAPCSARLLGSHRRLRCL